MYRQLVSVIIMGACSFALHAQTSGSAKKSTAKAKAAPKVIMKVTPQPVDTPRVHEPLKLVDFRDSLSYALGVNVIGTIQSQQLDINPKILIHALEDAFGGRQPCLTENDMMNVFKKFEQSRPSNQANHNSVEPSPEDKKKMEEIVAKGKAYLADNAKKEGVHTTASGLQYRVLTQGTGAKPLATDKVKVHYKGTLIDGKEFDSSYKRGTPIEFPLNGVIKGWTEGVQLMSVGSKYEFVIPAELAYGDRGAGSVIPPGSTLIFEVELLDIPSATTK